MVTAIARPTWAIASLACLVACASAKPAEVKSEPPPPAAPPPAKAAPSEPPANTMETADTAPPGMIDRDRWIQVFQTALPAALCKPDFYFRACFEVTEDECLSTVGRAVKVCITQVESQLPKALNEALGREWGQKLGVCTGQTYDVTLVSKKLDTPKCNDPAQWTSQ